MPVAEKWITERGDVIHFFICIAPRSGRGIEKIPRERFFIPKKLPSCWIFCYLVQVYGQYQLSLKSLNT